MPDILKILGVEVEEEFNIPGFCNNPYHFREEDYALSNNNGYYASDTTLLELLTGGGGKIEKLPWKPKKGQEYYTVLSTGMINRIEFEGYKKDYYNYNAGNCFKTEEEITPKIIGQILIEMKKKYKSN